jgi:hypothetical protein
MILKQQKIENVVHFFIKRKSKFSLIEKKKNYISKEDEKYSETLTTQHKNYFLNVWRAVESRVLKE